MLLTSAAILASVPPQPPLAPPPAPRVVAVALVQARVITGVTLNLDHITAKTKIDGATLATSGNLIEFY